MSKRLIGALQELKNRGDTKLVAEAEALLSLFKKDVAPSEKPRPVATRLLAHAARLLTDKQPQFDSAHNFLGAAVEAFKTEKAGEKVTLSKSVLASLPADSGNVQVTAFTAGGPLPDFGDNNPDFEEAPEEVISVFANVLLNAGYVEAARKYLTAYNMIDRSVEAAEEGEDDVKSQRQTLIALRDKYRKQGQLVRAKSIDEIIADLGDGSDQGGGECKSALMEKEAQACGDEAVKEEMMKACYMMKAAEEIQKDPSSDQSTAASMMKAAEKMMEACKARLAEEGGEGNPAEGEDDVMQLEPAGKEETEAQAWAVKYAAQGNTDKAREMLKKAERLRHLRVVAALAKKGDFEMALAGLKTLASEEAEEGGEGEDSEDKNAGMSQDKAAEGGDDAGEEENKEAELPAKDQEASDADKETVEREAEGSDDEDEDDEEVEARTLLRQVKAKARKKDLRGALVVAKKIDKLEKEILAAIKTAKKLPVGKKGGDGKTVTASAKKTLVVEGQEMLKAVHLLSLKAQMAIAEELDDDKLAGEIADAMESAEQDETLDDTLDAEPAESENEEESEDAAEGGEGSEEEIKEEPKADDAEGCDDEMKEGDDKGEAEGMHYEVLQSIDDLKKKKITRDALAFTFWDDSKDPFWVIQAAGKPVAEIHLADQDNAQEISEVFCDETKYPNVMAQSMEKAGLYPLLKTVKARFYANAVTKGDLAEKMKGEATASMATERKEKLTALRTDLVAAMTVAAEGLNKGLIPGKPNALKKAFVEKLLSLGYHNPALLVEDCFNEGFKPFLDQVTADANEYLDMHPEAFAVVKRTISAATNISQQSAASFSNETLRERLGRTSMPLQHIEAPIMAPAEEREIQASLNNLSVREQNNALRSKLQLGRKF